LYSTQNVYKPLHAALLYNRFWLKPILIIPLFIPTPEGVVYSFRHAHNVQTAYWLASQITSIELPPALAELPPALAGGLQIIVINPGL
jgi:hypothetical protein